jgi:hypothetical protein
MVRGETVRVWFCLMGLLLAARTVQPLSTDGPRLREFGLKSRESKR